MRYLCQILFIFIYITASSQNNNIPTAYRTDTGFYSSFDQTKIYYEIYGSGKPVVFIHGFLSSGKSWKNTNLFHDLISSGHKVILLDLRGNGLSDKPHNDEAYSHDAEAKDIMGLVRYLHLGRYDAIGYSRGSIILARLLILDHKIHYAVMGGMGTGFTNPSWPRRIMFYEALSGKPVKELENMISYIHSQGLDTIVLALMQKYQPSTSESALGRVKRKVLVICGDKDEDNGSGEALCKMIPNSIYISVPGDHNNTVRSREFSEAVVSFLK